MNSIISLDSSGERRTIDFLWMELTNQCNMSCSHCYTNSSPSSLDVLPLSITDRLNIIEDAFNEGCKKIQFIGGEPTLYKGLIQLIEKAVSLGYEFVEVYTNLLRLLPEQKKCFISNKIKVATSLYSYSQSTHDSITKRPGSFYSTIENLKEFILMGVDMRVSIIQMEENRADTEKTIEFLRKEIGVNNIKVDNVRPFGRAGTNEKNVDHLCGTCAGSTLCVAPDGWVYPCIMSKSLPIGSLKNQTLQDILTSASNTKARRKIRESVNMTFDIDLNNCAPDNCAPIVGCPPLNKCAPEVNSRLNLEGERRS